jgi:hypothetical protein
VLNRKKKARRGIEEAERLFAQGETMFAMMSALEQAHRDIDTLYLGYMYGFPPDTWSTDRKKAFLDEIQDIETRRQSEGWVQCFGKR